jgi:hypothetical protein
MTETNQTHINAIILEAIAMKSVAFAKAWCVICAMNGKKIKTEWQKGNKIW